jgi:zinc protease
VDGIAGVTAAQVRRAAARYLDPSRMTVAAIRPAQAPRASEAPPAAAAMRVHKAVLSNGATALLGVDRTLPLAAIVAGFRGGVRVEEAQTQGLCNLVATMLTKGTQRRDATAIADLVESWGGSLQAFSGRDEFGLGLELLADDVGQGLALLHELLTASTFPEAELAVQRELILKQLEARQDEIFHVGTDLLRAALFQTHPYRFQPLGAEPTVRGLTRAQCLAFAGQWVRPSNLVIAVFGDIDDAAVLRTLERTIGAMRRGPVPWPQQLRAEALDTVREAAKVFAREQALVLLGFRAPTYRSEDRDAVDVLTALLSGMAGRLFQAVREAHGLSYTLGAAHAPGWDPGYLVVYAATKPQEQWQALETIEEQLGRVASEPLGEDEVEQARRYLIGAHRLDVQELAGLAKRAVVDELRGVGHDAWQRYEERIRGVSAQAVQDAARRYVTLQRRAQVLVSPQVDGRPE